MFKKELSLILAFCMIFTAVVFGNAVRSSADAAVVNIDFSAQGFENAQELTTLSVGGVDVTFDKGEGSSAPSYYDTGTGARLYGGNSMTVSSSVAITQIKFTFTQENGTLSASVGTLDGSTWTGSADSVTITRATGKGHFRIKAIEVTLVSAPATGTGTETTQPSEDPSPTGELTVGQILEALYALESGKSLEGTYTLTGTVTEVVTAYNAEYKNVTVNMVCDGYPQYPVQCFRLKGEGADIIDTGDTITVTGVLKRYNNTYEFDKDCTLDSYTHVQSTEPEPTTPTTTQEILEALYALEKGKTVPGGPYTLTGKITKVVTAFSSEYNNVTVNMVCEGFDQYPVQCFRLKGEGVDVIGEGDTITVTGTLKRYNDTYEFDQGCNLDSYVKATTPGGDPEPTGDPAPTYTTPEEIINAAYALEPDTALEGTYTLTGEITTINTAYSDRYKNITVTIVVEGFEDKPIQCFRLEGEGIEGLMPKDKITVEGTLKNYHGTVEFDAGCKCLAIEKSQEEVKLPETTDEIMDALYALEAGESLPGTYTLKGVITEVQTAYSAEFKNVSVVIKVAGHEDRPVLCYRLEGEGADKIQAGDTITVKGTLKNYNGTREFNAGCTILEVQYADRPQPPTGDTVSAAVFACVIVIALAAAFVARKKREF